jgi:hypothetical protein
MPLHFLTTLQLPVGFTNQLDRILRQCLWGDRDTPKPSLAAWEMVCKPNKYGGLGIVDFQKQNAALLIKYLDKFYNHRELPWVNLLWTEHYHDKIPHASDLCGSFWWKDVLKLVDNFRGIATVKHGNGNIFLFWRDSLALGGDNIALESRFPRLFSYAWDTDIAAARVFGMQDITYFFQLPLSSRAYEELLELQLLLQQNPPNDHEDIWTYYWGEKYTASKFYQHIHAHLVVPPVFKWLWKSCCIMKTKTFAWLLLAHRLNTRDLLQRRHWIVTDETHCVFFPLRCHEDIIHFF